MNTPDTYFENQYAHADDPWKLAERWYDRRKYELTLAALPRQRYRRAFEPGCSVGVLTSLLATRCDRLLAADRVDSAVSTTARRTDTLEHVQVRQMAVPDEWPDEALDLVVLSELLYYFDARTRARLLGRAVDSLDAGGHLVTVHWNHPVAEHTVSGREIAAEIDALPGLGRLARYDDPDFTLTVHERRPDGGPVLSPAQAEDLA
ncbi:MULTISPECIES: SAM-dependent methyltransferase [unclassified Streptomyces]|uniref:SAM-dependent methyltransferase n=1 Tax=unclassified Streptomyces TaxID=2593676 RepID=UPI000DB97CF9|nr:MULTISPECIES: SAM-dependent methyltransferase [unclassified Streptomyces]MYT68188.1 methyltransferase domain-containing protein [Streptomyces sp. SID8367]